jgi:hypothetical protein
MEEKENKLKAGDVIYTKLYNAIHSTNIVERVTPTQAICNGGNIKFTIDISNYGTVRQIGKDRWNSASYYLETEELKQQLWRQRAINKCKTIEFSKLNDEQLKQIIEITEA